MNERRPSMKRIIFKEEFPSTLEVMPDILCGALKALSTNKWIDSGEELCARLCLEEALVNAITHGNQCDRSRFVGIEIAEEDDCCRISVHDEGMGFAPEVVTLSDCEEEGGRGLCLIKHFMEEVTFDGSCNCLNMTFRRNGFAARKQKGNP